MPRDKPEHDPIDQTVAGGDYGCERQLLPHYDRLLQRIANKISPSLRSSVDAEDILQETFIQACRHIGTFQAEDDDSLYRWLATIAEHVLTDEIKAAQAQKRGGGRKRLQAVPAATSSSVAELLDFLTGSQSTPSTVAARHEAEEALHAALAALPDSLREAIRLRYLEGLAVAEVAARMNRTERAVHMLCNRGKKMLREALGSASRFFSGS